MSKTPTFRNAVLDLLFLNTALANVGDASGLQPSSTAGSLYISLHTADPNAGNQTTSEATYTGYARQPVARSGSGWSRTANVISNAAAITFPQATGGSDTLTHVGIGSAVSGSGNLHMSGALNSSLAVSTNVQPQFAIGALTVTET